jgi:hypothetical protein
MLVCWICGAKLPFAETVVTQKKQPQRRPKKRKARLPAPDAWRTAFAALQHRGAQLTSLNPTAWMNKDVARLLISVLAVILWVGVVTTCGYFMLSDPMAKEKAPAPVVITMGSFEQLKTGMTVRECADIIGTPGAQQDLTYIQESGLTITTHIWQNNDGSNIMAQFENGRLSTKAQAGLPKIAHAVP